MSEYRQNTSRAMTYPKKGTMNRFIFKSPLVAWRLGFGPLLSHEALGGSKMLVLSSWGRKSNLPRHTMLSYSQIDGRLYVSSGWGADADWYKNSLANPLVTVQVGRKVFSARARRVQNIDEFTRIVNQMFETGGDSHFEPWLESYGIAADREDMIAKRDRLYIVGFDPSDEVGPPPLPVDLIWVWGLTAIISILVVAWQYLRGKKS